MKNYLKIGTLATCIAFSNLAFAISSTLIVDNNVPEVELRLTTDLLCAAPLNLNALDVRYTTPLDENPILYNKGPVKASWKHCALMPKEFFERMGKSDHSKIYVSLLNTKNGDRFMATIQTKENATDSREIHFSGKDIDLKTSLKLTKDGSEVLLRITVLDPT